MSGIWLISFVVLWLLVIGLGLVVLALAREVEALHARLDSLQKFIAGSDFGSTGRGRSHSMSDLQTPGGGERAERQGVNRN